MWKKYCTAGQVTDENMAHAPYMLDTYTTNKRSRSMWTAFEMWWHTRKKSDIIFRRNGRVDLNRRGRQFSRLLAAEVCGSAVGMLDTPCSEVAWRVLTTHSIRQFPLHFPSRTSLCAISFQLESNAYCFSTVITVARTCLNVGLHVHCLPCYGTVWL